VGKVRRQAALPLPGEEDQIRGDLSQLDMHKFPGPDEMQPRVLEELADVIVRPLSTVFYQSSKLGDVPKDCGLDDPQRSLPTPNIL